MVVCRPDIFKIEKTSGRGIKVVLCISNETAKGLSGDFITRKRLSYHQTIIEKAREYIKESKNGFVSLREVYVYLMQFVPENRNKNIVYKILKQEPAFETYIVDNKQYIRLRQVK